jgi:hypothetical protein
MLTRAETSGSSVQQLGDRHAFAHSAVRADHNRDPASSTITRTGGKKTISAAAAYQESSLRVTQVNC